MTLPQIWPSTLRIGPIREWPGTLRPADKRKQSRFSASLTSTLRIFHRELNAINAQDPEMLIAIGPEQFRRDGYPRAAAQATHPGIVLSFTTDVGHLSYPCDLFTTWQDNFHAVALALEALRLVDRYGVTSSGEQYRGFLAIEQHPRTTGSEEAWLRDYVAAPPGWTLETVLRYAKRRAHPDTGGDADIFARVVAAERALAHQGRYARVDEEEH